MKEDLQKLSVYVSKENHTKLKVLCATKRSSMNSFIDKAIRDKIEKDVKDNIKVQEK
jgi:predicted HicB family RNase H-like nuclease